MPDLVEETFILLTRVLRVFQIHFLEHTPWTFSNPGIQTQVENLPPFRRMFFPGHGPELTGAGDAKTRERV